MGYMGFGMRKENYSRKPKRAFTKLKEVYGHDMDIPKSKNKIKTKGPISFKKHDYKPFYQTRIYKITKRSIVALVFCSLIWAIFIQSHYDKYQKDQFEAQGFAEYYKAEMSHLSQLFEILDKQRNKLVSIRYFPLTGDYNLRIKHPSVHEAMNSTDIHFARFDGGSQNFRKTNDDAIDGHIIILKRQTSIIHEDNWVYAMNKVVASQIPSSIIKYLEMDEVDFLKFLAMTAKLGEKIKIETGTIYADFHHDDFGYYDIIYSEYELKSSTVLKYGSRYKNLVGKLDDNVYWTRQELF